MKQALDNNFLLKPYKQVHGAVRLLGIMMIWFSLFDTAWADQRREKDLDRNGHMDQVLIYNDAGTILRVETDANEDGFIEITQIYTEGTLVRIERDIDGDQKIDCLDLIENKKRVCQEIRDPSGNLIQVSLFDDKEQIQEIKKDTTQNQRFDTHYYFNKGVLASSTRDTDDNGKINIWTLFDDQGRLAQTREDTKGVGKIDQVRHYQAGLLCRVELDGDGNGFFETVSLMENNQVVKTLVDTNQDGTVDQEVFFDEHQNRIKAVYDSNFDGKQDIWEFYTDNRLSRREQDENFDEILDGVAHYNKTGILEKLEEWDQGSLRITWYYDSRGIPVRGEEDKNRDGKVEIWYAYEKGLLKRVQEDTNGDGRPDLWEEYDETQAMVKREKDLDFDGRPDFTDVNETAETGS